VTTDQIVLDIIIAVVVNELLGTSRWLTRCAVLWAAARWKARSGIDHSEEWLADLAGRTDLLNLFRAIWLCLSAVVPPEWLTPNLPSLWRAAKPFRQTAAEIRILVSWLIWSGLRGLRARFPGDAAISRTARFVLKAAVSLLPPEQRRRYLEEWTAELAALGRLLQLRWALSILLAAPRLSVICLLSRFRSR
jgi:hypothetical protein